MKKSIMGRIVAIIFAFTIFGLFQTVAYASETKPINVSFNTEDSTIVVENIPEGKYLVQSTYDEKTSTWNGTMENVYLPVNKDGEYVVKVFKHVRDNRYATIFSTTITVSGCQAFLGTSEVVNQFEATKFLETDEVKEIDNLKNDSEKVNAIYNLVKNNLVYDTEKANTVQSRYTPEIDEFWEKGKGICYDYAAAAALLLREEGIPCKVIFGYAEGEYHAWNSVNLNGKWIFFDSCWGEFGESKYQRVMTAEY